MDLYNILSINGIDISEYLGGGSSENINQLTEDVNELKQNVAGIEEVDETQNENIINLKNDVQTLQTSDTVQEAAIDKLRHQIILAGGFYKNGVVCMMETYNSFNTVYSFDKRCNSVNSDNFRVMTAAEIDTNNSKITLKFYRRNSDLTKFSYYVYSQQSYKAYGFVILNGLGEQVLNNKIIMYEDLATNTYLEDLINSYGTDYYKAHVNDTFYYDLLQTNCTRVADLTIPLTYGYTSSEFDEMTNLKTWVKNKIKETTLKCPVDMYISTDGMSTTYTDHQIPFRVINSYKIGGNTADSSGYYIAFHSNVNKQFSRIISITVLAIKSGQKFPTFSWDSSCKFYKCAFTTDDANKYGGIYFIMNDGTTCYSHEIGRSAFLLNTPKYVHFISDVIKFDALKNNVCSNIGNVEIEASTGTYDTSRKPYCIFDGTEGSFTAYDTLYSITD
jgi:hypothetical protein